MPLFLFKGLLNLCKHDVVKQSIANPNQLKFLIEISDEFSIIYDILWSLSFDLRIQEQLCSNQAFVDKLEKYSTNEQMKKVIRGIQLNINSDWIRKKVNDNNSIKETFEVMISYCHDDKTICVQVYDELIRNGFHVWDNFNETHEDVIDVMISTIEQTRTIIICMSKQYKLSNYCRAEAQYAFKRNLKIIPVLIEDSYQPGGWLSFITRNSPQIDFTKLEFARAMQMILNELKTPCIVAIDSLIIRHQPQNIANLPLSTSYPIDIGQWTPNDVQQWLNENNFSHMAHFLSGFDGSKLLDLSKTIAKNTPQQNLSLFQRGSTKIIGNVSLSDIDRLRNRIEDQDQLHVKAKKRNSKWCCRML